MRTLLTVVLVASFWSTAGATPTSTTETHVLIVTNNQGAGLGRPNLKYADDDGAKYYKLFSMLAPKKNIVLLTKFDRDTARLFPGLRKLASDPTRRNLIAAATQLAKRTRTAIAQGRRVDFYFIFAGHGDVDRGRGFIELQDASFGADDLKKYILKGVPSTRTHLIADSCNSYFLIHARKPGGRRFATPADAVKKLTKQLPRVGVFLSTNAEAEVYEWSELQSGIFSHAVRSGLAGGADANRDGRVTYRELEAFVATAVAGIRNPLYRPKVFAKAPLHHQTLARLTRAKAAVLKIGKTGHRRFVVRDRDGIPWFDAHREAGESLVLRLPTGMASGGWVDHVTFDGRVAKVSGRYQLPLVHNKVVALADMVAKTPAIGVRGPSTVFRSLFSRPFGPKALAAFNNRVASSPPPVFGISRQDAKRMELLLANIGDVEHRGRMMGTSGLAGIGALTLGAGVWLLRDGDRRNESFGYTLGALGAGTLVAGVIGLLRPSPAEKLRRRFVSRLARGDDPGAVVAMTEKQLQSLAKDYRRTRMIMRWSGLAMMVASASMFVLNERRDAPNSADRVSFGALAVAGAWASFSSRYRYPIENMVSIWKTDPAIQRLPRLTISPLRGGALVGLGRSF